jgi:hypothetical protein
MPNPENIIGKGNRFKKGESGNPAGRPPVMPDLNKLLAKVLGAERIKDKTAAEEVLQSLYNEAKAGNVQAIKLLLDRAFGAVPQQVNSNVNLNSVSIGYDDAEHPVQP